jgi:mRNA interferase RelE/StbE
VYEALIERTAERELKSLPTNIFNRIVPRIKTLSENPRPSGCHKLAGSRNDLAHPNRRLPGHLRN